MYARTAESNPEEDKMRFRHVAMIAAVGCAAFLPGSAGAGVSGKVVLTTQMGGKVEVPAGSGDPDGKGFVAVKVNPSKGKLCFGMEWERITDPSAAHIHKAPRGSAGSIKFTLFEGTTSSPIDGCFRGVKFNFLNKLATNPEAWYVNLHNSEYPDGAIRGQLKFAGTD